MGWRRFLGALVACGMLVGCAALGIKPPDRDPGPTVSIDWDAPITVPTLSKESVTPPPLPPYTGKCETVPESVETEALRVLAALVKGKPGKLAAVFSGRRDLYKHPYWLIATRMSTGEVIILGWSKKGERDLIDMGGVLQADEHRDDELRNVATRCALES